MSWLISNALMKAYENSRCLPEPGEEYSEVTSSDGAPSALLSGSPTQQAYLPPDRMTAFLRPSRSGMTFRRLTADLGAAVLTWCLEVSRARTSASQAKEPALTEPAAECGDTWRGSLARFDPATSSWRTAQPSLLEDLGESSVIWPRSGMTAGGRCWELPTLEHRISGTGSGFWPTPTASAMPCEGTQRIMRKKWLAGELSLEEASAIAGRDVRKAQGKVPEMWPTPTTQDNPQIKGEGKAAAHPKRGTTLGGAVRLWPTPTAHNAKETNAPSESDRNTPTLAAQAGGSLNPTWVELLMGWPAGWTDLKPLGKQDGKTAPQESQPA